MMNKYLILTSLIHLHFVVYDERICERAEISQQMHTQQQTLVF